MQGPSFKTPPEGDGRGTGGPAGSDEPTTPRMPKAGRPFEGESNMVELYGPEDSKKGQ